MCAQRQVTNPNLTFGVSVQEFMHNFVADCLRLLSEDYPLDKKVSAGPFKFSFAIIEDMQQRSELCLRSEFEHGATWLASSAGLGIALLPDLKEDTLRVGAAEMAYGYYHILLQRGYSFKAV